MRRLGLTLVSLFFAGFAHATVLNTMAVSDLTVSDLDNDGTMDNAMLPNDTYIRVFGVGAVQRGLWEYDLSTLGTNTVVDSVSVLFEDRGTTIPGEVSLYGYAGDGVASISDGDLIDHFIGSFTFGATNTNLDYNISLDTSFFQNLVDMGASHAGIVMVSSDEFNFGPGADICSIESSFNDCSGSVLTVNYTVAVPEPASLALLGLGLVGIGFVRRRKIAVG